MVIIKIKKTARKILQNIANSIVGNLDENEEKQKDRVDEWVANIIDFIKDLLKTKIAIVVLPKAKMPGAISVFEQVNRGGTPLDIYDLLVARMARHKEKSENLTSNINGVIDKKLSVHDGLQDKNTPPEWDPKWMDIWDNKNDTLSKPFRIFFKNCLPISCLYYKENGNLKKFYKSITSSALKEKAVLDLLAEDIYNNWKTTVEKLLTVMQFLQFRCGVVKINDLSYRLLVVPLFICCLKDKKPDFNKMEYWYWASMFSGHYRQKQSDRIIDDSKIFLKGKKFEDRAEKIFSAQEYSDKESLLREGGSKDISSSLDDTILQYVVSKYPFDLLDKKKATLIAAYKLLKELIKEVLRKMSITSYLLTK